MRLIILTMLMGLTACNTVKPTVSKYQNPIPKITQSTGSSFWKDHVKYVAPAQYAKIKDNRGVEWEIAYLDLFEGNDKDKANAETVIFVHGRSMNSGYWGEALTTLSAEGFRVIAIDMPNYGKSIPGNLNNSPMRSFDDVRAVLHGLMVEHLGIKQAHYLGHSIGGQVVSGYAINYPDAVKSLVLYAPSGVEETKPELKFGSATIDYINPNQLHNIEAWKTTWAPFKQLEVNLEANKEDLIKRFTAPIRADKRAYLSKQDPITQYLVDVRLKPQKISPEEARRQAITMTTDTFHFAVELNKDDPNNLYQRSKQIKAPIFLALGALDPIIPVSAFTGNQDLKMDMVKPYFEMMKKAGNAPIVKIYENGGHFFHRDTPKFVADVVTFLKGDSLADIENPKNYKRIASTSGHTTEVPPVVQAILDKNAKAFLSKDIDIYMSGMHKDIFYRDMNYAKWQDHIERNVMPYINKYRQVLSKVEVGENRIYAEGTVETDFGDFPFVGAWLKRNGKWLFIGSGKEK